MKMVIVLFQFHVINSCYFWIQFFSVSSGNSYPRFMILKLPETCTCQKSFPWIFLKIKYFFRHTFAKHQSKAITVNDKKTLKFPLLKMYWEFIIKELTRKFIYVTYDILKRIISNSHYTKAFQILGISHNFIAHSNNIYYTNII